MVLRLADKSVDALCNLVNITAAKEVDCKYINVSYEQLYTVYISMFYNMTSISGQSTTASSCN